MHVSVAAALSPASGAETPASHAAFFFFFAAWTGRVRASRVYARNTNKLVNRLDRRNRWSRMTLSFGVPVSSPALANTTTELLEGLHQQSNRAAWNEFDRRYRPILVGFLRRMGLNETDAADVAQETLACFVQDYRARKYDREKGRLRSWLIGIARYRLADVRRRAVQRRELRGESAIDETPAEGEAESAWEAEEKRFIFEQAVADLRRTTRFNEQTISAFERVVLRQEPVETVSAELGLTPQEIYNAKNRVVERLRELVKRYEECFVGG